MDWSKVDAALAGALADDDGSHRHAVFVHLAPDAAPDAGPDLGVGPVRTATLSRSEIDRLSEQAWVGRVRLSRPLGLYDGP